MWILILPMLAQVPEARTVLDAEHARAGGVPFLLDAVRNPSPRVQLRAARALGRLEDTTYRSAIVPLTRSGDRAVRAAAFGALAQMRAAHPYGDALADERDGAVRAAIFEAAGRARPIAPEIETLLQRGLGDAAPEAREGAARGLEALFRLNRRTITPSPATLAALRQAFATNSSEALRQLVLLAMIANGGADEATRTLAQTDASAQVRRLSVIAGAAYRDDPSPLVRYEGVKFISACDQLLRLAGDSSGHVAMAAIASAGTRKCAAAQLVPLATAGRTWRIRAAAREALIAADSASAAPYIAALARDSIWQVRARAAAPAAVRRDVVTLAALAQDVNPNVAATALQTADDVQRALRSDHAGLLLAAATVLEKAPFRDALMPRVVGAFNRLTADGSMTMRDPRVALLTRIGESQDTSTNSLLRETLHDRDPAVAAIASKILTARTGTSVPAVTVRLPIPPIPPAGYIRGLAGATARITMRGLGTMTVALLPDEAPVTVGVFAQLAESGQYNGLTFHRIVSNFVIQGGSPGADEYDGRTREFMRDEVGFARNARGTIGISTRGRDTGDGQIYFNLVDNFRLDRDYTVLARMVTGFDVMDQVQEGDVIERIEIIRARRSR